MMHTQKRLMSFEGKEMMTFFRVHYFPRYILNWMVIWKGGPVLG